MTSTPVRRDAARDLTAPRHQALGSLLGRVWAVDASPEMVARAKELGVNARVARAEALPFKQGWYDAVVSRMAIHLMDRGRAFSEMARVLTPNGRLTIATEDPDGFENVWFTRYFPAHAPSEFLWRSRLPRFSQRRVATPLVPRSRRRSPSPPTACTPGAPWARSS